MSKDEQKSKSNKWVIIGSVTTIIFGLIATYYQFFDNKNQMGGSMDVMWQNYLLDNYETKKMVICLENDAIRLDSLIVTPTFVNNEAYSLKDFSLTFEVNCESVTLAPSSDFDETKNVKNTYYKYTYNRDFLAAHNNTPDPFSCKLNGPKGYCQIKSRATYNGIRSAFECFIDVRFFVVPNENNLSFEQWKRKCDSYIVDEKIELPYEILYFPSNPNNKVIAQKEVKPNNPPISGNNYGIVTNNHNLYDGFSHAFNSDSTCIVFSSKSNDVHFVMKLVEGGTFLMGAQFEDSNKPNFSSYDARVEHDFNNETPVHQVSLNSFYLGETEVTQELWRYVIGYEPSFSGHGWIYGRGDDYPAYYISLKDCKDFVEKLNSMTGLRFRLPTEEEWEFAARGGRKSKGYRYAGGNDLDDLSWYCRNSGAVYLKGDLLNMGDLRDIRSDNKNKTHPVKTKSPNELGLYDMSGNVWEICSNKYYSYLYSIQINNTGDEYVRRGGSWGSVEEFCRVSCRDKMSGRHNATGFRLALSK